MEKLPTVPASLTFMNGSLIFMNTHQYKEGLFWWVLYRKEGHGLLWGGGGGGGGEGEKYNERPFL